MVGLGGGFKKQDVRQGYVAGLVPRPQGEHLRRIPALVQQTGVDGLQAPGGGGAGLLSLLHDVIEGLQVVLEGLPGQIAVAGDVDQGAVGVPPPQLPAQGEAIPVPVL